MGYRYDEANRLAYVDDTSGGATVQTTSYTYNPNGSLEIITYPNTVTHTYAYDTLNRLRTLQVGRTVPGEPLLRSYEYHLQASGHRHQISETYAGSSLPATRSYQYDGLYRLTSETVAGVAASQNGTVTYTLDKVGNREFRVSSMPALSAQTSSFNARDQLASDTYDANGNTTVGGVGDPALEGTDTYDFEDRLIRRLKPDGSEIRVSYDADGIRRKKVILDGTGTLVSTTDQLIDTNNLTGYAQVFEGDRKRGQCFTIVV